MFLSGKPQSLHVDDLADHPQAIDFIEVFPLYFLVSLEYNVFIG
jgi:hypothetical protein